MREFIILIIGLILILASGLRIINNITIGLFFIGLSLGYLFLLLLVVNLIKCR